MIFAISALYAVALAIIHQLLTFHVIIDRGRTHIAINHGEDLQLATRIRRHGNFIEGVPMALILLALAEVSGAAALWLHSAGALLIVARIIHAFGLHHDRPVTFGRIAGVLGTTISMAISAISILLASVG